MARTTKRRLPSALSAYLRVAREAARNAPSDDLVTRHLPLAVRVARAFAGRGVALEDLIGVANLVLVDCARQYPTYAKRDRVPFAAYLVRALRVKLATAIREAAPVVYPQEPWEQIKYLRGLRRKLQARHPERPVTDEELADASGLPVERVRELLRMRPRPSVSLDAPLDPDDPDSDTLAAILPDEGADPEAQVVEQADSAERRAFLVGRMEELPPLARLAVSLRYGVRVPSLSTVPFDDVARLAGQLSRRLVVGLDKLANTWEGRDGRNAGAVVFRRGGRTVSFVRRAGEAARARRNLLDPDGRGGDQGQLDETQVHAA